MCFIVIFFFKVQPLYDSYQREVEINLWEPINRYWAECYEACKMASKKRSTFQTENRTVFQVRQNAKIPKIKHNFLFSFFFLFHFVCRKRLSFPGKYVKLKKRHVWMRLHCSINDNAATLKKSGNVPSDSCTGLVVLGLRGKWWNRTLFTIRNLIA